MKKKSLVISAIILGVALVLYFGGALFLGAVVKAGVNTFGPRITGTRVELAGASVSPLGGSGTLSGLVVGNPPGWSSDKAFSIEKIHVEVEPSSLFRDRILIHDITIDGPEFVYESRIVTSNIKDLLNHIEQSSGADAGAARDKSGRPIRLVVDRFRLTGVKVTAGVGPAALKLTLPPIELDDLGADNGGLTPGQLSAKVMTRVLASIVVETAKSASQVKTAGKAVEKLGDGLKQLLGK